MKLMLDKTEYSSKPTNPGVITNNIIKNPVDITPEELAQEIIKGKSFVPGYINTYVDGKLKRNIKCWTSQQIICLDFDNNKNKQMSLSEAIEEFKDTAMFIYTTFSHNELHHKFRVVFSTDKIIENYSDYIIVINDLLNNYLDYVDEQCKDGSRLFYGGNELYVLNYNNRLNTSDILTNYHAKTQNDKNLAKVEVIGVTNSKNIKNITTIGNTRNPQKEQKSDHFELIKNKDIETLHNIIKPTPITFHTHEEVYDYLNKQDLTVFLGTYSDSFNCLFHNDKKPSAGIFVDGSNDHYIYKCFSSNCSFGAGKIRKCTERILQCDKVTALRFLRKVYMIDYYETEWQKHQKEILDENIRYLYSEDFKSEYPQLYSIIYRYLSDLMIVHEIAKNHLPAEGYSDEQIESLFFASLRHMNNVIGNAKGVNLSGHKRITDRISLFTYLGLLFKLKEDEIPEFLLKQAKKQAMDNKLILKQSGYLKDYKSINLVSFYSIPSYSDNSLKYSTNKAVEYKENHFTMKGWSREMILRALGEEEANRIYPQMKNKKISELSKDVSLKIEESVLNYIDKHGYTTEELALKNVKLYFVGQNKFKHKQIKKILSEMLNKYDLIRVRLNKELKISLNINLEGYPFVIIRNPINSKKKLFKATNNKEYLIKYCNNIKDFKKEVIKYVGSRYDKDNQDIFTYWNVEEVKLPKNNNDFKTFICFMKSTLLDLKNLHVFFANNIEEVNIILLNNFSISNEFKKYINNTSLDDSFAKQFYYDDKGYLFSNNAKDQFRNDIIDKFKKTKDMYKYINKCFKDNIDNFFNENKRYGKLYYDLQQGKNIKLSNKFYKYVYLKTWIKDWNIVEILKDN